MVSSVIVKCVVVGTEEVLRLRVGAPLEWNTLRAALAGAFGASAAAKYEDDENDWCSLTESTFEDFLVVRQPELNASQVPVMKLRVGRSTRADSAFGTHAYMDQRALPIPDGIAPGPAEACGPKPFLMALQQLSHGCLGGWTAENVCTVMLAFMPTLEQRALRKVEKMNKMGSAIRDTWGDALEQLNVQLGRDPGLESETHFLQDIRGGRRVDEFGAFVIAFLRALQKLPCPKQKEILTPMLTVLLQARPCLFMEVFGEQSCASPQRASPPPCPSPDTLELPSGRHVPLSSVLAPETLTQQQEIQGLEIHLACLGMRSVAKNAWANLRISEKGVLGVGGVGSFATFTMFMKGHDAQGLQKVALQSCGGGGFLSMHMGGPIGDPLVPQFSGSPTWSNSMFLLKPLGCKGVGEQKAPAFALLPEGEGSHAVGIGAAGEILSIPVEKIQDEDNQAAFFIIQSLATQNSAKQAANLVQKQADMAAKQAAKLVERETKRAGQEAKQKANLAEKEAKEARKAAKLAEKKAKQTSKSIEQNIADEKVKLVKKEVESSAKVDAATKQAAKLAEQKIKQDFKFAEKQAKQGAKVAEQQAKTAKKAVVEQAKIASKNNKISPVTMLSDIVEGALLFVESTSGPGRLRINKDGEVDAKGGWGKLTIFVAQLAEKGADAIAGRMRIALQSQMMPERFLRLPSGSNFMLGNLKGDGKGVGNADSVFEVTSIGGAGKCKNIFNFRSIECEVAEGEHTEDHLNFQLYMMQQKGQCEVELQQAVGSDSDWQLEGVEEQDAGAEMLS